MAEALADRRQAHPVLNERCRVAMAQLVQGADDTRGRAVRRPARLHRLVAQRPPIPVFQLPEQRPVLRLRDLQVAPQQPHELRVIEQYRPPLPALPQHVQVLIVGGQVEVIHIELERLADEQPGLRQQPKQELVAELVAEDGGQNGINGAARHATWIGVGHLHPVELEERIGGEQVMAHRPGQEAAQGGRRPCPARRTSAVTAGERRTHRIDGDRGVVAFFPGKVPVGLKSVKAMFCPSGRLL